MGDTDTDLILSRTHAEFTSLLEGAALRDIDKREFVAWEAMAHAYATNAGKKARQNKIFNAKAARNRLKDGFTHKEDEIKRTLALNKEIQGFNPMAHFQPKGGSS